MKLKDRIILGLILVLFSVAVGYAGYGVKYIFDSNTTIYFDLVTRKNVSSLAGTGLDGDDTTLYPDFGSTSGKVCEGDDTRLHSSTPNASNADHDGRYYTETETDDLLDTLDTGVQLITTTSPIDDDGTAEQPNIIIEAGYTVPTDAEKGHYDDAYTHSQDNSQAHSDYLTNDAEDTGTIINLDEARMDTCTIYEVIKMTPLTNEPANSSEGWIYWDSTVADSGLKVYLGATWRKVTLE